MGTRGICGWVIDGDVKAAYNHWDSYPGGLGADVIDYVRPRLDAIDGTRKRVRDIVVLDSTGPDVPAPPELVERAAKLGLIDTNVGGGFVDGQLVPTPENTPNLYQCLRGAQGRLDLYEEVGHMEDGVSFARDSLFCEWGYLVNLDAGVIEVYRGFQREPHNLGRFAHLEGDDGYAPIALLTEIPFGEVLPSKDEDESTVTGLLVARIETLADPENDEEV